MGNYLPLIGGTLSGDVLTSKDIYPTPDTVLSSVVGVPEYPFYCVHSKNHYVYDSNNPPTKTGYFFSNTNGTAETQGTTYLYLGNNIANGTVGNSRGFIRIYDTTEYSASIRTAGSSGGLTANRIITIPDATGYMGVVSFGTSAPSSLKTGQLYFVYES